MLRVATGLLLLSLLPLFADEREKPANDAPDFQEVYDLLRAHLAGATEAELNRTAVQGLLEQLHSRAALADESRQSSPKPKVESAIRTAVFDGAYGYMRIGQVQPGLDRQVSTAYQQLVASNQIKGVVLDLRFAGGADYETAAA